MTARAVLALAVAAAVCVLGALILGEYQFTGSTPYVTGLLLGLIVSEFVLEVGKVRHPAVGITCAALVAGSLLWAAWISSGEGLRPFPASAWAAMAIGAVAAGARTWGLGGRRRHDHDPDVTTAG